VNRAKSSPKREEDFTVHVRTALCFLYSIFICFDRLRPRRRLRGCSRGAGVDVNNARTRGGVERD